MINRLVIALVSFGLAQFNFAEPGESGYAQPLEKLVYYPQRTASATVISLNNTTLSAQIEAQIAAMPVLVGNRVAEGATLVQLDCADYQINLRVAQARLNGAEARLRLAENQLTRVEKLVAQQLTSQEDVDARSANRDALAADVAAQRAERDRARLAVSRCDIKAPFAGLVTERLVAKGQLASIGTRLVTLIDQRNIVLSAQVSFDDAEQLLDAGSLNFNNGKLWPVKIRTVVGAVDSATRNREVRLTFSGERPLPGAAGKLVWRDPRPFIPARFIVKRGERFGLFVAENGIARFVPLQSAQPGRDHPVSLPLDTQMVAVDLPRLNDGDSLVAR